MTRLAEIGQRLERAARGPDAIDAQLLFRVARSFFALTGWRARIKSGALTKLIAILSDRTKTEPKAQRIAGRRRALDAAIDELEENVVAVERVVIVRRTPPIAHVLWLRRVVAVLELAEVACDSDDVEAARAASRIDPSLLFPPLVPLPTAAPAKEDAAADRDVVVPDVSDRTEEGRLVDLELAAIDHLVAAARAESVLLGRKRRLLVAARQRLLEASAALTLDRRGVRDRTSYLAREITRIDRLEAAGVHADVSLVHQAREALTRRDAGRLFATVSCLDANALAAGDRVVSARTGPVLARSCAGEDPAASALRSLERSAVDLLGDAVSRVSSAVDDMRGKALERMGLGGLPSDREGAENALAYLPQGADVAIVRAAIAADGFFEVGGALLPVRITEEQRVQRVVRHPTQELRPMPADGVDDLRDAVIGDPRSILLDLATGRLFARRFVRDEVQRRPRIVMRGEVRVYVLDGSTSMFGARARVRDAILVAELCTLMRRLESPGDLRCTLHYRYFDEELGRSTRVDTVPAAHEAIRDVVTTVRQGGTNIQKALLASIEQIAETRASDPDLARAQIVLVTDGESPVDEGVIVRARDRMKGLPIGVSVIALGEENPALRGLVARQRAKGEAAFYHFLSDAEIREITEGALGGDVPLHPPERWTARASDPDILASMLDDEVGGLIEELEHLDRERDHTALEQLEDEAQARREVGLTETDEAREGERARVEALRKDRVALDARYARWFPAPAYEAAPPPPPPPPKARERDDIDAVCCALASVAEVVALLGGTSLARQADAIDLLQRLLPDAQLTAGRYRAVLREHPAAVAASLRALRDAVRGSTGS